MPHLLLSSQRVPSMRKKSVDSSVLDSSFGLGKKAQVYVTFLLDPSILTPDLDLFRQGHGLIPACLGQALLSATEGHQS